jgi:DNA invertase Pin-like site-specific DNA recombinase
MVSKLTFTILAAVAEAERDRIRERITEAKRDQRRRGLTWATRCSSASFGREPHVGSRCRTAAGDQAREQAARDGLRPEAPVQGQPRTHR